MTETIDLYTTKDVANVRKLLTEEQGNLCAITGIPIEDKQHILEHAHDDQMFVRGVASRQTNAALGICENMWTRYMKWWYPRTLPEFLRELADYIQRNKENPDTRYRHNSWLKKVKVLFNKLSSKQQNFVLESLCSEIRSNPKERKELFAEIVLDRSLGYARIVEVINQAKELT